MIYYANSTYVRINILNPFIVTKRTTRVFGKSAPGYMIPEQWAYPNDSVGISTMGVNALKYNYLTMEAPPFCNIVVHGNKGVVRYDLFHIKTGTQPLLILIDIEWEPADAVFLDTISLANWNNISFKWHATADQ